jgi:superfamily I DNA/RNA helicase
MTGADDDGPGVRLAAMHRIRGLEFTHVLVAGANAGDLPPFPVETADSYDLLQERCLLHLAATRARDTLTITGNGRLSPLLTELLGRPANNLARQYLCPKGKNQSGDMLSQHFSKKIAQNDREEK